MGLLDDAIREHLEFKRLHGADPGEVAREEHEALGPVYRGEEPMPADSAGIAESLDRAQEGPASSAGGSRSSAQELPHGGQETAELDMRTVLKTEQPGRAEHPAEGAGTPLGSGSTRPSLGGDRPASGLPQQEVSAEDSLEWEVPRGSPAGTSKHAEDSKPGDRPAEEAGEPVEDVLEETPDFLRETPDQERLWFEQQPPRDFDFDK